VTVAVPTALAAADELARELADPRIAWNGPPPPGARAWPQSLAGGAAGIALLHIERARAGLGSWKIAHRWVAEAVSGQVSAAANANLYFGAPALAFVLHIAAAEDSCYRRPLERLDQATVTLTNARLAEAHARIARGDRPEMREFDLIRGLSGLGAYHLSRRPQHPITRRVLNYLARLTEPLPDPDPDGLPPWWTSVAPNGEPSSEFPDGHGNLGVSHGISSALAVMSLALLRGQDTAHTVEAIERLCVWTDHWRQGGQSTPWWPGLISPEQQHAKHINPALRPRPSWCYGAAGIARAQQLAGLALGEPERVQAAENAILAAVRDPGQLDQVAELGLCHGTAGLLHCTWRIATDSSDPTIAAQLPSLAERLMTVLEQRARQEPDLLDGTTGAALALHTVGTGTAPAPCWDTFLALA
jgi:hypothetical protein